MNAIQKTVSTILKSFGVEVRTISKRPAVKARYDIVDHQRNSAGGRMRRPARIEQGGEEAILTKFKRDLGVNLSRDMLRNYSQVHGLAKTLRANIVGDYGKLRFNGDEQWFKTAQNYFNNRWAKHADFRDGTSFRECLQLAITALAFEGDFVAVFDDGLLSGKAPGSGKLFFFESDQIVNLRDEDFAAYATKGWTQESGIVRNEYGRKIGVIVSHLRGQTSVPLKSAFILLQDPDDPDAAPWRHVTRKFRFQQLRGVADSMSGLQLSIDGYEMLGYELQTAKIGASRYATVIEAPDVNDDLPSLDELAGDENGIEGTTEEGEGATTHATEQEELRMQAIESITGGLTDYAPAGTQVIFDPTNRPNTKLSEFLDWTNDMVGMAHGLTHSYARSKADSSYTAFKGDLALAALTFRDFRQFLEDSFADWVAVSALRHAISTGKLAEGPEGWEDLVAWTYPILPEPDEQKAQSAIQQKIKNGLATYDELIGPNWKEQFDKLAEQIAYAREKGLPLSALETVAGAIAGDNTQNNNNTNE